MYGKEYFPSTGHIPAHLTGKFSWRGATCFSLSIFKNAEVEMWFSVRKVDDGCQCISIWFVAVLQVTCGQRAGTTS